MTPRIEPFRVLPWDFFANDAATAPPHVEALQISGAPREFELLKRGQRVYFRLRNDAARVWATLDDSDDANFVRTFRRAIGSGRIGRVFERQNDLGYNGDFYFSVLMSARGEVQAREWCATRWFRLQLVSSKLSRYLQSNPKLGVFHPQWAPPFRQIANGSRSLFYRQPFDEADRDLTSVRLIAGDAIILEHLSRAYLLADPRRTRYRGMIARFRAKGLNYRNGPTSAPHALCADSQIFPDSVRDLITAHFRIGGVRWECEIERDERAYWEWDSGAFDLDLAGDRTVSAHDQLENHLTLRDWLTGKLAPARIEEILNSLRP